MRVFWIMALALVIGGYANAEEWATVSSGGTRDESRPRPGQALKFTVEGAAGQTNIITRDLCNGDSSFSTDSASTCSAAVQTCKEGAIADIDGTPTDLRDCENDLSAGTVTAGNYAIIRQGTFTRLDFSACTTGDILYFDCNTP